MAARYSTVPTRSTQAAPPEPPPARTAMPAATGTPTVVAISEARAHRELAVTRVISSGSSRGMTDALVTPNTFCRTRTPKAAGSRVSVSLWATAPAIPQHSRPRARAVPIRMYRRPCCTRSSIGPTNGASSANGAIVMIRASATRPRAWVTEALKNSVPARATATNPSPTLPAAENSIIWARPVRPAPDACVILCNVRVAPPAAADPARPTACEPVMNDRAACLARPLPPAPLLPELRLPGPAA